MGERVVCKSPINAPEFSEHGQSIAIINWCEAACTAHGFRWVGQSSEIDVTENDFDLGTLERRAADKYLPKACLPFDPGRPGIVAMRGGGLAPCLGGLFRKGPCRP